MTFSEIMYPVNHSVLGSTCCSQLPYKGQKLRYMTVISLLVKEVTEREQNDVNKIGYVLEKLTVAPTKMSCCLWNQDVHWCFQTNP